MPTLRISNIRVEDFQYLKRMVDRRKVPVREEGDERMSRVETKTSG